MVNTETTVTLHAGSEKSLTCRARNARPQAKIVWFLGEEKIVDQGRERVWGEIGKMGIILITSGHNKLN